MQNNPCTNNRGKFDEGVQFILLRVWHMEYFATIALCSSISAQVLVLFHNLSNHLLTFRSIPTLVKWHQCVPQPWHQVFYWYQIQLSHLHFLEWVSSMTNFILHSSVPSVGDPRSWHLCKRPMEIWTIGRGY